MDECRSRVRIKCPSNTTELSKSEKSCCTNIADMLLQTEVRRDGDTENTDVLARNDGVISMTQTRTGTIK